MSKTRLRFQNDEINIEFVRWQAILIVLKIHVTNLDGFINQMNSKGNVYTKFTEEPRNQFILLFTTDDIQVNSAIRK
jgi:hypothetical protein